MKQSVHVPLQFSQAQFDEFARLTGDDNPIHVDPEFAARTQFGRTVAHGMFIFSVMNAAVTRDHADPVSLSHQELIFTKPTFADDKLTLILETQGDGAIDQQLLDGTGEVTSTGRAVLGDPFPVPETQPHPSDPTIFKGLQVGMTATRSREFTRDDVDAFLDLVDDPGPAYRGQDAVLPPGLIGGAVSWLLGVDLPGPGTKWLKQLYNFHGSAPVPATIDTTVTITRLRPMKNLVNLLTRCESDGEVIATGESLVLVSDLAG